MKWWNDLWLKESFAAYLENLPLKETYPDWDLQTSSYLSVTSTAFEYDSILYTHSIKTNEMDPVKMRQNYDPITYEKVCIKLFKNLPSKILQRKIMWWF